MSLVPDIIGVVRWRVDAYFLHYFVYGFVLCPSVWRGQRWMQYAEGALPTVGLTVTVSVKDGFGTVVEGNCQGVVCLLCSEGDMVAVNVSLPQP